MSTSKTIRSNEDVNTQMEQEGVERPFDVTLEDGTNVSGVRAVSPAEAVKKAKASLKKKK